MKTRIAALLLALALCAGCSTSQAQINRHNAAVYVAGVLDETYSGAASDAYYALTGRTAEDAQKTFQANLEAEYTQRLAQRFELDDEFVSRTLEADFLKLLDTVYRKASYQVKEATPLEGGRYCVELTVTPVTFFAAAYQDGYKALREDFEKTHSLPDEDDPDLTGAQARKATERFQRQWAQAVYDYLYGRLDAVTTGGAVTKLVLVSPDSQGLYALSDTDLRDVDDLILQY